MQMRTFYSKCTPQAVDYLDQHVNEWLEKTKAKVAFTNQTFGIIEGKGGQRDPHLFLHIWYETE